MSVPESGDTAGAERWAQVERFFAAALDTPPEGREALLDVECTDPTVSAEVRRLLSRHDALSAPGQDAPFLEALDGARAARLLDDAGEPADPATIGRYEVVRRLGRGATGVVYLAHDPSLGRDVALKLLSPWLSADPTGVRRFTEEARAASGLDHPHIAAVHEIGRTTDDRLFIAMAYHEGQTLRERLGSGALPVADAVRIAAEVGAGLGAAHGRGIVHRDIKPENILLTARGACIVDFGIAKVAGQTLTLTGAALGTAAYMSPEQTRGGGVDGRSDLWSLGVVLYEMLAGVRPFRADGGEALVYGIRHDEPEPVTALRPETPAAIAAAVRRCLDKNPAERFPSADALVTALRSEPAAAALPPARVGPAHGRRAVALAGLAAVGALLATAPWRGAPAKVPSSPATSVVPPTPEDRSIAVLLFAAADDAADSAEGRRYLASEFTSSLSTALGATPHLRLAAPSSVEKAVGAGADAPGVGRRLGVTAVLRGSIGQTGDRIRVSAELLGAADGRRLWAEVYDRPAGELLPVQREISRAVAAAVGARPALGAAPRRPVDPVAYELYLRGRFAFDPWSAATLAPAALYFREAIARDSTFARAYVALADVYTATQSAPPAERFRRAKPLVAKALALDGSLAEAHKAAGWIAMWYDHDWAGAERYFRRSLALDPSDVWTYHCYAALLSVLGRTDESLALTRQAAALDPMGSATATHVALHLLWRHEYPEAIAVLEQVLATDTTWQRAHSILGRAYLEVGRYDEAIRELRRDGPEYAALEPKGMLAYALGKAGHTAEARERVAQLELLARGSHVSAVNLVAGYIGLGDTARALDWAERLPDDRGAMIFPLTEPMFDALRGSPRFDRVLERLGLAEAARHASPSQGTIR